MIFAARRLFPFASLCALLLASWAGALQPPAGYPNLRREIRHIIPWGAGGATDTAMRGFMQYAEKQLGVRVVTENIPGGLSSVGLLHLKAARPDGYTLGTLTYDVLTLEFQGLAPVRWSDFELVATVTEHPSALVVATDRWRSLEELRKAMVGRPGKVKMGNVGTGGIWHQHAAAMEKALGVKLTHVPYEAGSGAQLAALLGGEVDGNVSSLPVFLPYIRDKRLRVLGVMSEARDELVPDAPTFKELGYDLVYSGFRAVVAPKGTPPAILAHLESALRRAFDDRDFQAWAEKAAIGARWRGAKETHASLEALAPRVRALMADLGLK
jgi:tripartite-type tricarboxylate transporter receptor subunit TctC